MGAVNISGYTFSTCSTYESPALRIADTHSTVTIQLTTRPRPDDLYTQKVFTISNSEHSYLRPLVTSNSVEYYEGSVSRQSTSGYSGVSSSSKSTATSTYINASASYTCTRTLSYSKSWSYTEASTRTSQYTQSGYTNSNTVAVNTSTSYNSISSTITGSTFRQGETYLSYFDSDSTTISHSFYTNNATSTGYMTVTSSIKAAYGGNYYTVQSIYRSINNQAVTSGGYGSFSWRDSFYEGYCRQTSNGGGMTATFGAGGSAALTNGYSTWWNRSLFTSIFPNASAAWNTSNCRIFYLNASCPNQSRAIIMPNGVVGIGTLTRSYTSDVEARTLLIGTSVSNGTASAIIVHYFTSRRQSVFMYQTLGQCYVWCVQTQTSEPTAYKFLYYHKAMAIQSFTAVTSFPEFRDTFSGSNTYIHCNSTGPVYRMNIYWTANNGSASVELYNYTSTYSIGHNSCSVQTLSILENVSIISSKTSFSGSIASTKQSSYTPTRTSSATNTVSGSTSKSKDWVHLSSTYTYTASEYYDVTTIRTVLTSMSTIATVKPTGITGNLSYTTYLNNGNNSFTVSTKYSYATKSTSDPYYTSSTNTNGACTIPNLSSTTVLTRTSYYTTTSSTIGSMSSTTAIYSTIRV